MTAMPESALQNTVFVTLQINAGAYYRTPGVIGELQAVTSPDANSHVPVQVSVILIITQYCGRECQTSHCDLSTSC